MKERLTLVEGSLVKICAQDKDLGDAENFVLSRSDEETLNVLGAHGNVYTVETVSKYMPEPSLDIGEKKIFSIIHKDDERYIGDIRLVRSNDSVFEIGICILISERCKGFGSDAIKTITNYAYSELNASKVRLRVYQNNPRAKKLYEKLGFIYERTEDDNYFIDGSNILEDWMYIPR